VSGNEVEEIYTSLITPPTIAATIEVVPVRGSKAKEDVT
jgi:hypothetical protein